MNSWIIMLQVKMTWSIRWYMYKNITDNSLNILAFWSVNILTILTWHQFEVLYSNLNNLILECKYLIYIRVNIYKKWYMYKNVFN